MVEFNTFGMEIDEIDFSTGLSARRAVSEGLTGYAGRHQVLGKRMRGVESMMADGDSGSREIQQ